MIEETIADRYSEQNVIYNRSEEVLGPMRNFNMFDDAGTDLINLHQENFDNNNINLPTSSNNNNQMNINLPSCSNINNQIVVNEDRRLQPTRKAKENPFYIDNDFDEAELVESEDNIVKSKSEEQTTDLNDSQETVEYDVTEYLENNRKNLERKNEEEKMDEESEARGMKRKEGESELETSQNNQNELEASVIKKSKLEGDKTSEISFSPDGSVRFSKTKVKEFLESLLVDVISQL